jgi:hypothetical protein
MTEARVPAPAAEAAAAAACCCCVRCGGSAAGAYALHAVLTEGCPDQPVAQSMEERTLGAEELSIDRRQL